MNVTKDAVYLTYQTNSDINFKPIFISKGESCYHRTEISQNQRLKKKKAKKIKVFNSYPLKCIKNYAN